MTLDIKWTVRGRAVSKLVDGFRQRALALAGCTCGWAEPDRIKDEGALRYYYYDSAGIGKPRIPQSRHCRHRAIERALVRAYRAGRRAAC